MNTTKDFPLLKRKINKQPIIYLDNAATTQKPRAVLQAMQTYYEHHNANIHRGIHTLGEEATEHYEQARTTTANFFTAQPEEIIFTSGTTGSINTLARSYLATLPNNSEILTTTMEHHSNYVPWQQLSKHFNHTFITLPLTKHLTLDEEHLKKYFTKHTKLLTLTHVSNVTGIINDITTLTKLAHDHNILVAVDGAQAAPHVPINLKHLNVDFYSCSGHKLYGPTGIGILYGKQEHLETMHPSTYGGGMIKHVNEQDTTWNDIPAKYEAGTPNIAGAVGLAAALTYLKKQGMDTIYTHAKKIATTAYQHLTNIKNITIYGKPHVPIISFNLKNIHPHDVATGLNTENIMVRAGNHCCMPLMKHLGINGTVRASFGIYNNEKDITQLTTTLQKTQEFFTHA